MLSTCPSLPVKLKLLYWGYQNSEYSYFPFLVNVLSLWVMNAEMGAQRTINLITSNTSNENVIHKPAVLIYTRTCTLAYKIKWSNSFWLSQIKAQESLIISADIKKKEKRYRTKSIRTSLKKVHYPQSISHLTTLKSFFLDRPLILSTLLLWKTW